ncbi:MAG: protein kinase [Myxococcota bacterium]
MTTSISFPFTLDSGRYHVERVFADSGGMGLLFEGKDTQCADNQVLLKTTRYDSGRDARHFRYTPQEAIKHVIQTRKILDWEKKMLVRFRNEGVSNIPSPNDYFFDRSITLAGRYEGKTGAFHLPDKVLAAEPFLVMEHIPGQPLEEVMREHSWRARLEEHLLMLSRELLTIFGKLHDTIELNGRPGQFLYQDLKPANVLVSADDYFTLVDFGAVTLRLGNRTTEPTAGCITTGYAAPEASGGRESEIDPRFDVYTLGATLWHAVTLQDPRDMSAEFPRLDPGALQGKGVSSAFIRIVTRALHPNPDERYPSADAMRRDVMARLRDVLT